MNKCRCILGDRSIDNSSKKSALEMHPGLLQKKKKKPAIDNFSKMSAETVKYIINDCKSKGKSLLAHLYHSFSFPARSSPRQLPYEPLLFIPFLLNPMDACIEICYYIIRMLTDCHGIYSFDIHFTSNILNIRILDAWRWFPVFWAGLHHSTQLFNSTGTSKKTSLYTTLY